MTLSTSYWPADFSQPVVDPTVGDALRGAAAEAPSTTALVEGVVDPAARRPGGGGATPSCWGRPSARRGRCWTVSPQGTVSRCGPTTFPNG